MQQDVWPENMQILPEGASVAVGSHLNSCKEIAMHSGATRALFQNSSDFNHGAPNTHRLFYDLESSSPDLFKFQSRYASTG